MAKLTAEQRKKLPTSAFAIPSKRAYPIEDANHAENALSRVSANGTPAEKSQVRNAVDLRYPSMGRMDDGGPVPVSGPYDLQQGEMVLPRTLAQLLMPGIATPRVGGASRPMDERAPGDPRLPGPLAELVRNPGNLLMASAPTARIGGRASAADTLNAPGTDTALSSPAATAGIPAAPAAPIGPAAARYRQDLQQTGPSQDQLNAAGLPSTFKGKFLRGLEAAGIGALAGGPAGKEFLHAPEARAEQQFAQQTAQDKTSAELERQQAQDAGAAETADLQRRNIQSEIDDRNAKANQPAKPDRNVAPETDTYYSMLDQVNPKTGQKYTPQEALAAVRPQAATTDTNRVNPIVEAEIGPRPDAKNYPQGVNDPKYKADSAAWGKQAEGVTNRMAGASGEARAAAYGRNRPVQVLDTWNENRPVTVSAADAEDSPDRYVTAGSTAANALKAGAAISDIRQGIDQVRNAAGVLDTGFTNKAAIAAALGQPATVVGQFLLGEIAKGNLTQPQADYVVALQSLMERTMSIRNVAGMGSGAEDLRKAILNAIPGPGTPSKDFATKQLNQLEQMVGQLERGVPNVPLRNAAGGQGGGANSGKSAAPNDPLGIR